LFVRVAILLNGCDDTEAEFYWVGSRHDPGSPVLAARSTHPLCAVTATESAVETSSRPVN
jgi:hypothetical protein